MMNSYNKFFVLNTKAEVYQTFQSLDLMIGFLQRTGYLNTRIVIVAKSNGSAKLFDRIDNLTELQKSVTQYLTS